MSGLEEGLQAGVDLPAEEVAEPDEDQEDWLRSNDRRRVVIGRPYRTVGVLLSLRTAPGEGIPNYGRGPSELVSKQGLRPLVTGRA